MIMALKDYQIEADFFREQPKKICIIVLTIFEICRQWKDVSEIPIVSFFNIKKINIQFFNFKSPNVEVYSTCITTFVFQLVHESLTQWLYLQSLT